MSTEQGAGEVVVLTQEELAPGAKLLPPGAVSIGGLAVAPAKGDAYGAADEPPETKCTTHIYHLNHEIHIAEVCGGGDSLEIVSDIVVGSV